MTGRYLKDDEIVDEIETRTSRRLEAHIQDMRYRTGHRIKSFSLYTAALAVLLLLSAALSLYWSDSSRERASIVFEEAANKAETATAAATSATTASSQAADAADTANTAAIRADTATLNATKAATKATNAAEESIAALRKLSTSIEFAVTARREAEIATQSVEDTKEVISRNNQQLSALEAGERHLREELRVAQSNIALLEQRVSDLEEIVVRTNKQYNALLSVISQDSRSRPLPGPSRSQVLPESDP